MSEGFTVCTPEKLDAATVKLKPTERRLARNAFLGGMMYAQGHLTGWCRMKKLLNSDPGFLADDGLGGPVAQLILTLFGEILHEEMRWKEFWK